MTFSILTISQQYGINLPSAKPSHPMRERGQAAFQQEIFADLIKIININVNGFRSKEAQLRRFISEQGNNCIFAFNDTRLKQDIQIIQIPGYSMIREDKTYNGTTATAGGVALLIPQGWSCLKINIRPTGDQCETLSVIVTPTGRIKPFKLSTIYNHPGSHISSQFITNLRNHLSNGESLPMLFVGDLNSPHRAFGSRTTNEYGNSLFQIINNEGLSIINNTKEPTYYSNATGLENILDLVIADNEMNRLISCCTVSGDIGSDHYPVVTTLNLRIENKFRQKVNMKQWSLNAEARLNRYVATKDIDKNIHAISQIFKETKEQSTFTCKM